MFSPHKYLEQLNGNQENRKGGVYTIDLKKKMIWTKDDEGNYFEQHADGNTKVFLLNKNSMMLYLLKKKSLKKRVKNLI